MRTLLHALVFVGLLAPHICWGAEPTLAGHWKLDDKSGDTVLDSSPAKNHGKAMAQPGQTLGKVGGAFSFNGKDSYVEIKNSKDLEKIQEGSYTIAAWFKPEIVPPGTEQSANDAEFGIVIKTGWHEGLSYNREKKFVMTHWLSDGTEIWHGIGTWEEEHEPGQWYHLVGTVDRAAGKVAIYLNGELKNSLEFTPNAAPKKYDKETWKIGIGSPGAKNWSWPAKGSIDDVRIYGRSLGAADVKALYEGK